MRAHRFLWTTVVLAAACSAPGDPSTTDVSVATSEQPIIRGARSTALQNYVVLLYDSRLGYECTGTLIGPNVVLTARHCVTELASGDAVECDQDGHAVRGGVLGADLNPGDLAVYVGATRTTAFPQPQARGVSIFHDNASNLCAHDFALVQISPPITSVNPAAIRLDAAPSTGEKVTIVGWGITDGPSLTGSREQRNGVRLNAVGPASFDGVPVPANNFLLGESICDGDSGGPAIAEMTGAVIGVASSGTNGQPSVASNPAAACVDEGKGVMNTFTAVAPFKNVVLQAFASAGGQPIVDDRAPPPAPVDDGNAGGGGRGGGGGGGRPWSCSASPGAPSASIVAIAVALAAAAITRRRWRRLEA